MHATDHQIATDLDPRRLEALTALDALDIRLRLHISTLDRNITFTRHADSKAAPLLALQATLAAATVTQTDRLQAVLDPGSVSAVRCALAWILLLAYALPAVASLALAIRVFVPATPGTGRSVFYFEDIRRMSLPDFLTAGTTEPDVELERDLLEQIHAVSAIAARKFGWLRISFFAAIIALAAWLPLVVVARL
jgi:hypothetical protein